MSHHIPENPVLPPWPDLPYVLDGIHDGIYDQARFYWNVMHSVPHRSLHFFAWCVRNWLQLRGLHQAAFSDNFDHIFDAPYTYFLAMVIVGANSELENYRYEWSQNDNAARMVIGFLYRMRNFAAQHWHELLTFEDSENDYYSEANMNPTE